MGTAFREITRHLGFNLLKLSQLLLLLLLLLMLMLGAQAVRYVETETRGCVASISIVHKLSKIARRCEKTSSSRVGIIVVLHRGHDMVITQRLSFGRHRGIGLIQASVAIED
jgi:hypothetical protein